MRKILLAMLFAGVSLQGQKPDPFDGMWQGYDGEWRHCSQQVMELAQAFPEGLTGGSEKSVTSKTQVMSWLKRSLDAVKIAHANEHMGQLVAYARVNGIAPPWSQAAK